MSDCMKGGREVGRLFAFPSFPAEMYGQADSVEISGFVFVRNDRLLEVNGSLCDEINRQQGRISELEGFARWLLSVPVPPKTSKEAQARASELGVES